MSSNCKMFPLVVMAYRTSPAANDRTCVQGLAAATRKIQERAATGPHNIHVHM